MEESSNTPSLSAADSKKWIVRIVLALVLGQAIWGLLVALTAHLLVPLTARVMGGDPASPLYLGKGDIDVPALFIAILEFCLAGIVAAVLNSWVQKPGRVVVRRVAAAPASLSLQSAVTAPVAKPVPAAAPPKPAPTVQPSPVQAAPVQARRWLRRSQLPWRQHQRLHRRLLSRRSPKRFITTSWGIPSRWMTSRPKNLKTQRSRRRAAEFAEKTSAAKARKIGHVLGTTEGRALPEKTPTYFASVDSRIVAKRSW